MLSEGSTDTGGRYGTRLSAYFAWTTALTDAPPMAEGGFRTLCLSWSHQAWSLPLTPPVHSYDLSLPHMMSRTLHLQDSLCLSASWVGKKVTGIPAYHKARRRQSWWDFRCAA